MKNIRIIVLSIVCVICVGLLVYFTCFFGDAKNDDATITTIAQKTYDITFDTDTLIYKGDTNFMQGVHAVEANGNDLTSDVTVSCKPTSNIAVKELSYSINKSGYEIKHFERKMVIDTAYSGPSIKVSDGDISIPINQVGSLSSYVSKSNIITTDDGFGRPCAITAEFVTDVEQVGDYIISIKAENMLGDTASTKINISVTESDSSIIKLTSSSITLNVGESFMPQDYVKSAVHKSLGDVKEAIVIESNVDTSKAGQYTVIYSFGNYPDLQDESATLYVTVK